MSPQASWVGKRESAPHFASKNVNPRAIEVEEPSRRRAYSRNAGSASIDLSGAAALSYSFRDLFFRTQKYDNTSQLL